jgi:hypothetical protein
MDASTIGTTALPTVIAALFTSVDEAESVTAPDGREVTYARIGTLQVAVTPGNGDGHGQLHWHSHDTEDEAHACYLHNVDNARRVAEALANGVDPRLIAFAVTNGIPIEIAQQIIGGIVSEEPASAPAVRAVGRAAVPTGTVYEAAAEPRTGMYL